MSGLLSKERTHIVVVADNRNPADVQVEAEENEAVQPKDYRYRKDTRTSW